MGLLVEEACPAGLHYSGFSCGNHQQRFSLKYQTFRRLAAAFISGSGLQSVHVCMQTHTHAILTTYVHYSEV